MGLATYSELKSAVAKWLDHDDLPDIGDFITLAEAQINRDVRHRKSVTSAELDMSTRFVDLPADHLATIRLDCNGNRLTLASVEEMASRRYTGIGAGQPCLYAPLGTQIELWPDPDGAYTGTMQYTATLPALSDVAPSNWLLTTAPDVYLYGTLLQSAPFLMEDARGTTWAGLYAAAVTNLNKTDEIGRYGGATVIRPRAR